MRLIGCILKIIVGIIVVILLFYVVTHISEISQFFDRLFSGL